MRLEGVAGRFGFYVTRFVDADDEMDANARSERAVWNEVLDKGAVLNEKNDAPELIVESVRETDPSEKPDQDPGFIWFPEAEWASTCRSARRNCMSITDR